MEIAVIGATGRTGRQVVVQAIARGHAVRAVTRHPESVELVGPGVSSVTADALDREAIEGALAGAEAVISTLGVGVSRAPTELYSRGITNVLGAMVRHEISRVVAISAAPAGPRGEQPGLERRILMPLLERAFGATYVDMRRMEAALRRSPAAWIALRPPRLADRPATGAYRMSSKPLPRGRRITCADLAAACLDLAERPRPARAGLYVAN